MKHPCCHSHVRNIRHEWFHLCDVLSHRTVACPLNCPCYRPVEYRPEGCRRLAAAVITHWKSVAPRGYITPPLEWAFDWSVSAGEDPWVVADAFARQFELSRV